MLDTPSFKRNRSFQKLVCALALILCGCTAGKVTDKPEKLVWPPPPDPARIAFVQSIHRPADVGAKVSGFKRLARWIVGSQKGNEPLDKPFGIALDDQDNLCLTDTGASAVCFWDRSARKWYRWESVGNIRFVSPTAVAKQKTTLYVADSGLGCVIAFDQGGKLLFQINKSLERPSGICISGGRLFVADSHRHCVISYDLLGNKLAEFGHRGTTPGEFNFPTHISADAKGNLYVTDSINSRVQIFDPNGHFKGQVGSIGDTAGHFSRPKGVALDSFGHIYVVDAIFDNMQIFDDQSRLLLSVGETGGRSGQFSLPNGIAISRNNEIYVADSYNHRVQLFRYINQP